MEISFFDITFWKDFVSNLSATLIGVALGIPGALFIDRYLSGIKAFEELDQERHEANIRKKQFLQMILESLQKNLALIAQIEEQLKPETVIFYNVDTQVLESTSSIKYEIIGDFSLNQRLDSIRYELLHFHRKIELQLEISYSVFTASHNFHATRVQLVKAIIDHIPRIKKEITEAIEIIIQQIPG